MRLAPEGNIFIYPLFFILVISFGIDFIFSHRIFIFYKHIPSSFIYFLFEFFRDPKRILPTDEILYSFSCRWQNN